MITEEIERLRYPSQYIHAHVYLVRFPERARAYSGRGFTIQHLCEIDDSESQECDCAADRDYDITLVT